MKDEKKINHVEIKHKNKDKNQSKNDSFDWSARSYLEKQR